jgi:hypothetical protein
MRAHPALPLALMAALLLADAAAAQFRRGMLQGSTEVTLYPHTPPSVLLPAGPVHIETRNQSRASARVTARVRQLLGEQLTENDDRLQLADQGVTVTATLVEWTESRRDSTKYVSERRQIGTRQVREKDGTYKTEPVYEYGRNKPSVVITGEAALRVEVRRRPGGTPFADETVRSTYNDEVLLEAGVPSREEVEDRLLDGVIRRGAGRNSPGRTAVSVMLARSDDVDKLNGLAETRRWLEWLAALETVKPHKDAKRDAYRLHNLAVAHEAVAYASNSVEDWRTRLTLAQDLVGQAARKHPTEEYIVKAQGRIAQSVEAYQRLAAMFAEAGVAPPPSPAVPRGATPVRTTTAPAAAAPSAAPMSNQDVIDLRAAGLDDANLIAAIKDATAVQFDLSPAALKALLTAKVSNPVIAAMRARNPK